MLQYRIEVSPTRKGVARVNFPGRIIALEANQHVGPVWLVGVTDVASEKEGSVTVRADNPGDAVWKVARATVRAMAELTHNAIDGDIKPAPEENP